MQVKDILRETDRKVLTIEPGRTVHDAICKLNEHRIGALLVVEEQGGVRGIITERDILRQCAEKCAHLKKPAAEGTPGCQPLVEDAMTRDLIIGVPGDSLDYVMGIMTKNRIRHLPILDDQKLVGIVSIGDVVNAHLTETGFENRMLKNYIHGSSY